MKIEHIAIWVKDLEAIKDFYCQHFSLTNGPKYTNEKKGFSSYFLSFPEGSRIELMSLKEELIGNSQTYGLAHIAISLGSKQQVDVLTASLEEKGIRIVGQPRTTGDGYYESIISDPEGNLIELTV